MSANLVAFCAFCFYANPRGEFRFFLFSKSFRLCKLFICVRCAAARDYCLNTD